MKNIKFKLLILLISALMVVSMLPLSTMAISPNARIEQDNGAYIFSTPALKVKLQKGKPDILFWAANETAKKPRAQPVFHIGFNYVAELFGDDLIVNSRQELGGKTYNLAAINWNFTSENFTDELRATLTSAPLANGATISFVFHIYLKDVTITRQLNDTTVTFNTKGLSEVKFDIIVSNWKFSENAVGLTFITFMHELSYKHRVKVGNGVNDPEENKYANRTSEHHQPSSNRTADPKRTGIEFVDDKNNVNSYFSWQPVADVYNSDGTYNSTVNVTSTVASRGFQTVTHKGHKFAVDYVHLLLTYPNYGNNMRLVHDPTIGIPQEEAATKGLEWSVTLSFIAVPIIALTIVISKRSKK